MAKRTIEVMNETHTASSTKPMDETNASSSKKRAIEPMDETHASSSRKPMDGTHAASSKKQVNIIHVPNDGKGFPRPWMIQPWVKVPHPTLTGVHYWFNKDTEESVWEHTHGAPV